MQFLRCKGVFTKFPKKRIERVRLYMAHLSASSHKKSLATPTKTPAFSSPQCRRHRRRNTARAPQPLLSRSRRGFQALYVGEDGAGNLHGRNRGACAGARGGPLRRRSGLHHPPGRRGLRHPQVDATRRLLVSQSFANTSPSLVVLWWPWLLALILLHPDANACAGIF